MRHVKVLLPAETIALLDRRAAKEKRANPARSRADLIREILAAAVQEPAR